MIGNFNFNNCDNQFSLIIELSMRLYLIGNGFDLYHGLPTKYDDFFKYVKERQNMLCATSKHSLWEFFSLLGKSNHCLWNNFEDALGTEDFRNIVEDVYTNPSKCEFDEEVFDWNYWMGELISNELCNGSLYVKIAFALNQWITDSIQYSKEISKNWLVNEFSDIRDSLFVTFNYTKTLEEIYCVNPSQILHIHGTANRKLTSEKEIDIIPDTDIVFGYSGDGCQDFVPEGDKQFIAMQIEGLNQELSKKINANGLNQFLRGNTFSEMIIMGLSLGNSDYPYSALISRYLCTDATIIYYCHDNNILDAGKRLDFYWPHNQYSYYRQLKFYPDGN